MTVDRKNIYTCGFIIFVEGLEWVRVGLASFEESLLSEVHAVRNHPSGCQEKEGNALEKVKHFRIRLYF